MLLELIRDRNILFFGGKGGVGKTTVSAASALRAAESGRRVLLVSTDPAHNLGHLFGQSIGPRPVRLADRLTAMELDPEQTVELHLQEVSSELRRLMPEHLRGEVDRHMELSRDAPGMQEAAMLERIAEVIEHGASEYDLIIFDTAPSGHTARLMALPEMMSAWTEGLIKRRDQAEGFRRIWRTLGGDKSTGKRVLGGSDAPPVDEDERDNRIRQVLNRRRERFSALRDALVDRQRSAFLIVLAAERLPVLETIELYEQLNRAGVNVAGLIVNKRLPRAAGEFITGRREQEEVHLGTLGEALPQLPRQDLELAAHDILGLAALSHFAHKLN
ncbi:ArsA family ATPase [Gilvimarinus sp. F26214L]|uniref:ArsA family ATPase n=1 Tax=Gilvimarinus sp. DZF01 TaxID=3461371 RepID=UPI0040454B4A